MAPRPDRYTLDEAARIVGLPVPRLRRWAREGFIRPSLPGPGRGACYSFQDLVGLRTAKSLLDHGIPLRRVRRSIGSLRQHLPEFQGDLSRLRIFADGQRLVVGHRTFLLDPLTGQLLLDFRGRRDGPQVQGLGRSRELAEEWFRRGLAADGDQARQGRALEAYQRAVELD
ncbi:MAG: MerR family transcriptional regulator, partial [Deltaproteobacteria bacterium]|nr:MerR family transcriptional regulator [Deltaproteobacteria bacterium]